MDVDIMFGLDFFYPSMQVVLYHLGDRCEPFPVGDDESSQEFRDRQNEAVHYYLRKVRMNLNVLSLCSTT